VASPIVGREEELASLHAWLDQAWDEPRALVLEGEAGIGKSMLWLAALEMARARGLRVLSSRPAQAERGYAFAGLGDVFEDVVDEVLPSLPAPRRRALEVALLVEEASGTADPRALGVAVRNGLEILAGDEPLVVAADDVQWLDRSSASALAFALRRLNEPVVLLLTRRLGEEIEPSEIEQALARDSVERLPVGPLSVGAMQRLLQGRLDRVFARPTLLRIHETSGGNPFYALELARALGPDVRRGRSRFPSRWTRSWTRASGDFRKRRRRRSCSFPRMRGLRRPSSARPVSSRAHSTRRSANA